MTNHTDKAKLIEDETHENSNEIKRIKNRLFGIETKTENQANHVALMQNYVEKYVPIIVQIAITDNIGSLPYSESDLVGHEEFKKNRWSNLHMVILNDDGFPKLYDSMINLKMKMDSRFYMMSKVD